MKIGRLIPATIAIILLLGTPFCHLLAQASDPRGGLVCYCCSAPGQKCTMISCSGCCGKPAGEAVGRWSPELVLEAIPPPFPLPMASPLAQHFPTPESAYLEIPHAPPRMP
jgi:hypothetical protein